jgi:hypothetical protein
MKEDYACKLVKEMIMTYKEKMDNADSVERSIYAIFINDLKGLLTDLIHH